MRTFGVQSSHPSLPLAFQSPRAAKGAGKSLHDFLERLLSALAPNDQPRIRYHERQGQPIWTVYDPISRKRHQFDTESAVRIWLEQRYYQ